MDKVWNEIGVKVSAACKELFEEFNVHEARSDEDWINFSMNFILKHKPFLEEDGDIKDVEESRNFLQNANRLYFCTTPLTTKIRVQVFKFYNKSIAYAPLQSQEIAMAYAYRSTILYELGRYELCIQDIDRALIPNCPSHIRVMICGSLIQCIKALNNPEINRLAERNPHYFQRLCLNDTARRNFIEKNIRKTNNENKDLEKITDTNREILCATSAVAIAYNEEYGRHVVAARKIEAGEIFSVEEPYSLVLMYKQRYLYCSNCLLATWALIPCDYCTCAMYCSEQCKTTHWAKYHDIECAILPVLSKTKSDLTDVFSCSLRLVVQAVREFASIEELRQEVSEVDNCKDPRKKGFSKDGFFNNNIYRSVLGLETNAGKRTNEQRFLMSINSCFILYYLATRTYLFGRPFRRDLAAVANNNDAVFIGSLLLRHQQLIRTNYQICCEEGESESVSKCGLGVLPFFSLVNHSCNPNVSKSFMPMAGTGKATYDIKEGEQVFDNYCPLYVIMSKAKRQKILSELYQFECKCQACRENWPVSFNMESVKLCRRHNVAMLL